MRAFVHPAIQDVTLEGILYALSDPVRLRIFVCLSQSDTALSCARFQSVNGAEVPKSTLSQHFRVLREQGLIRSERRGVEMLNQPRTEEMERRFPGLLTSVLTAHAAERVEVPRTRSSNG